jgi:hypothetical protein
MTIVLEIWSVAMLVWWSVNVNKIMSLSNVIKTEFLSHIVWCLTVCLYHHGTPDRKSNVRNTLLPLKYSVEIPTRCSFVIEFIIPKLFNGSTCFERQTAHHQELQTVFAASGLYARMVTGQG